MAWIKCKITEGLFSSESFVTLRDHNKEKYQVIVYNGAVHTQNNNLLEINVVKTEDSMLSFAAIPGKTTVYPILEEDIYIKEEGIRNIATQNLVNDLREVLKKHKCTFEVWYDRNIVDVNIKSDHSKEDGSLDIYLELNDLENLL